MGRKKTPIWNEFKITESTEPDGKSEQRAICNYCKSSSAFPNATRMALHLMDCKVCPEDVKKRYQNEKPKRTRSEEVVDDPTFAGSASQPKDKSEGAVIPKPKSQTSMNTFVEKTPPEKKQKIDVLLARAMFTSNVPFSLFENPYWQAAFREMRSSYVCPSRYEFSEPLLNAEYSRVMTSVADKLKSAVSLGIMIDGWSNIREEGIINVLISTPELVFYKNVVLSVESENAEFVANVIIGVIDECAEKYDIDPKKFFVLGTDNARVMKAAWVIVIKRFPHMCAIACGAHSFNLLFSDIMKQDSLVSLYKDMKSVVKNFKNVHIVSAIFKEKLAQTKKTNGDKSAPKTLKLPPETRWAYLKLCSGALLDNKGALQSTAIDERVKDSVRKNVRSLVLDEDFWEKVQSTHNFIEPISDVITEVEGNSATLSLIPERTHFLRNKLATLLPSTHLTKDEIEAVTKAMTERLYHCNTEVHFAANLLDPRYRGEKLDSFELHSAMDCIHDQCKHLGLEPAVVMADLANYRTKTDFYSRSYLWESAKTLGPDIWWRGFCASQPLQTLACRLLSARPSVGGCERDWSVQGAIHTKTRNRLKNERVEKLKSIKQNLRYSSFAIGENKSDGKVKTGNEKAGDSVEEFENDIFEWPVTDSESDVSSDDDDE